MAADAVSPLLLEPPHSTSAEQAVLGSLLLDGTAWIRVTGLKAADFYRPDHRVIFSAIALLAEKGQAIDVVTVSGALERRDQLREVGGMAYLSVLVRDTPTAANVGAYAERVRKDALLRHLIALGRAIEREATGGTEAPVVLMHAQEQLLALQGAARTGRGLKPIDELARDFMEDLDRRSNGHRGLEIGLADFDALTCGLEPGDLVVLAGRPGMGKTALLVSIATHIARTVPVAVFSAEMPTGQLMRRCAALLSEIPQGRFKRANELTESDWRRIGKAMGDLVARHMTIDDTPAPRLSHVRGECAALKARGGLGLVIVDYVQLVQGTGANRYEQLRDVAYGFKALAKDLAVPVVVLAQLNRGVESRAKDERRALASDLRDSGAIEEAADLIGLLYSEGYYCDTFEMPHVLECNIVKHRNGERGQCLWNFAGAFSRVTALEAAAQQQYRRLLAAERASSKGPARAF